MDKKLCDNKTEINFCSMGIHLSTTKKLFTRRRKG